MAKGVFKTIPWDPLRLPRVDGRIAEWSKGFLRCQPLRWFPDLDRDWHTFCLSLGWEASMLRVEPSLSLPTYAQERLLLVAQGEPLALVLEKQGAAQLGEMFMQSSVPIVRQQGLQYLGRRLIARMGRTWVGGGEQQLRLLVDQDQMVRDESWVGAVHFSFRVNARTFEGAFLLGPRVMGLLDGLWRRQLRSGTQSEISSGTLLLALGEVRVPPLELPTLLNPGTQIRVEGPTRVEAAPSGVNRAAGRGAPVVEELAYLMKPNGSRMRVGLYLGESSDDLVLRSIQSAGGTGRAGLAGASLAAGNVVVGPAHAFEPPPALAPEHSRVTFALGELAVDPASMAEFYQPGAFLETSLRALSEVTVFVAGEVAARATLGTVKGEPGFVATIL